VRGWRDEGGPGARDGEADGVVDGTGGNFVVADEAGEDGEAGGVGGSPRVGTGVVVLQIPDGAVVGAPLAIAENAKSDFVKEAGIFVDDEDVLIARAACAFDGSVGGEGHGHEVAFAGVGEVDADERSGGGVDHDVGNAIAGEAAKVRMQANGRADELCSVKSQRNSVDDVSAGAETRGDFPQRESKRNELLRRGRERQNPELTQQQ
jgi:hypothetical protein